MEKADGILDNSQYQKLVACRIAQLKAQRVETVHLASEVIGDTLVLSDFYYGALLDRSMRLIDGLILMLETRNLDCAGALLRLQLDNCLRAYAGFICADDDEFFNGYIAGEPVKNFKNTQGKKMSDKVLREALSIRYPKLNAVYEKASGYIHFSAASLASITRVEEDFTFTMNIGHELDEVCNRYLLECAAAFSYFLDIQYELLSKVAQWKHETFDNQSNQE